jgi:N,N'-diacetyllegionaminate synthase
MIFIAEIGLNYNGNLNLAYEMIRQAKLSGAHIAKFQLGWRGKEGEINFLDFESLQKIEQWCKWFDLEFMVSIFTPEAFGLAKQLNFNRYKIASRTLKDDLSLVNLIVDEGKVTYISLGMWSQPELPITGKENVKYLFCKSVYPSMPWDMVNLPKVFNDSPYHGYSDHTVGIEVALMAIGRGAKVIEKHFTLDKSDTTIRDHAMSATPDEFRLLTELGTSIEKHLQIGV